MRRSQKELLISRRIREMPLYSRLLPLSSLLLWLALVPPSLAQEQPRPQPSATPMPTQFELAMMQTLKGVKEGRLPDPSLRRPDGRPGTLLDALLPRKSPTREEHMGTRRLLAAYWRLIGLGVPFSTGPPLSTFNMSYYRYTSVIAASAVDWRNTSYITPVFVQYNCASCWVGAPADALAMAYAIATGLPPVSPSVQQYCDCSGSTCCQGGWPEIAFNWFTAVGNVSSSDYYEYRAQDNRTCSVASPYPIAGQITGWERVPTFSQTALMKAVNMQPVVIYISASTPDFIGYNSTAPGTPGFYVYDGNCSTEVNHAVVVVGYNTLAPIPYWIIKNSWPPWGWGDNGYMYLKMADGPGTCGMLSVPPLIPLNYPTAPTQAIVTRSSTTPTSRDTFWWNVWKASGDPCVNVINPCGSGRCYSQGGFARCNCTAPYVEIVGVPTSKCVDPSPCTNSQFNPCGAGTCMDIGDGGYICGCPTGYAIGAQVNGNPTCVPVTQVINTTVYVTQYGDSCLNLAVAFYLSISDLIVLNPYIDCTKKMLPPGLVVNVPSDSLPLCTQQYAVRGNDTCQVIGYNVDKNATFLAMLKPSYWGYNALSTSTQTTPPTLLYSVPKLTMPVAKYNFYNLQQLNPTLSCSRLFASQLLCVASPTVLDTSTVQCGLAYTTSDVDSCASVQGQFQLNSTFFQTLNPGINCDKNQGILSEGIQLCVAPLTYTNTNIMNCTHYYSIQQGDSCAQIWTAANLSRYQFLYINPGLQCQTPYLYVGQQVCINSPSLVSIPDPNFFTYTVQPNDTLAVIQSRFTTQCQSYSIAFDMIALQNGVSDWTNWTLPNGTIVIPCVPKIGAQCGCIPSLTVCGANFVNYPSYCDATCNFASPIKTGACTACQSACNGRYGATPKPSTACPAGYVCPYPTWPPAVSDASKVFACTSTTGGQCMCKYRQQTCTQACANYANTVGGTSSACYNMCYCCAQVPCGGPSVSMNAGTGFCTGGCAAGNRPCNPVGRACSVNCNYWNTWWQTNSITKPKFNP